MKRILFALSVLALAAVVHAADWPQWRGPKRDGVSTETGLLKEWPKDGPKLAWQFKDAGLGFSSVAIRDGKLYTLGSRGNDEIVLVLDAASGKELWTAKIGPVVNSPANTSWGDGPRSTPTLDGDLLFALGSQADLVCFDLTKKAEVWRKNLESDFGAELMTGWGYSESPLVDGDHVFVTPGGEKGTFLLLEKKTGKLVWQSKDITEKATYSSALAADLSGIHQFVQLSYLDGKGTKVNGIDAKTGKVLWKGTVAKADSYSACPTPIVSGNLVYSTIGYGSGACQLFEIKDSEAVAKYKLAPTKAMKSTHGGVVLIDGHVYGHSEGNGWVCQELATGKIKWSEKFDLATQSGATTAADGMLYLYTEEGECALVSADPAKWNNVSSFTIPEKSAFTKSRKTSKNAKVWNHPVVSGGHLFLRDCEWIFCYDIRGKVAAAAANVPAKK